MQQYTNIKVVGLQNHMKEYIKNIFSVSIRCASEDSIAANPFAAVCLDNRDKLYKEEYVCFFGNEVSPEKALMWIHEWGDYEKIRISLCDLPQEVEQVVVVNRFYYNLKSDLIVEIHNIENTKQFIIEKKLISSDELFAVARFIKSCNGWGYSVKFEPLSQTYFDDIAANSYETDNEEKKQESIKAKQKLQNNQDVVRTELNELSSEWRSIISDAEKFEDRMKQFYEVAIEWKQLEMKLEKVDWRKVSNETATKVKAEWDKYVKAMECQVEDQKRTYNYLCDYMEEIIFTILSRKPLCECLEAELEAQARDRLLEYRDFSMRVKEKYNIGRTEEQREYRHECFKCLERGC